MLLFPTLVNTVYQRVVTPERVGCDLSGKMVDACKKQGWAVHKGDVVELLGKLGQAHLAWAHLSLIHLPRNPLPKYIEKIQSAILPNGIFTIGFKTGDDIDKIDPADDRIPVDRFTSFHQIASVQETH